MNEHKLHDGTLYWPKTMSFFPTYPSLRERAMTQVAIIGGGMTGAICAATLAEAGIPAVLVEEKRVASASTAANTGLIQFSSDIMVSELADRIGEMDAVAFYAHCSKAVNDLGLLAAAIPQDGGYRSRSSLYCAASDADASKLRREYQMLRRHGLDADWGFPAGVGPAFKARYPAALVTHGDAEINPVRLANGLIAQAARCGVRVYEHTGVANVRKRGDWFVLACDGGEILARTVVRATGYLPGIEGAAESEPNLRRTFALATPPNSVPDEWNRDLMMWETARPYFYFRTTPDGRIVAGGLDEDMPDPSTGERALRERTDKLLAELGALFPGSRFEAEYAWCGAFGESPDDLPFIGEHPEMPGLFHALGYGGNGTVYGMLAASMLVAHLRGETHPLAGLLRPTQVRRTASGEPAVKKAFGV
ncbi:FAD-binding oxidoreductase [Cohnella ginsengisoli]|uniref:FAD-binding oxidoreductase n=1 Tax=Cohnella ginsengisoli TaxID=425004 RepID=A0A9X4KHA7_9BACL|nr:FAD-binding oxidoreductase [Cohnella ginsengisoli]MDG0791746.1 FAD-binding oxidoreductase [Cohnella ginsengisoli]